MSKIGRKPITIPSGIKVEITSNSVLVKNSNDELRVNVNPLIVVKSEENILKVERKSDKKEARALHGLVRSLLYNAVKGLDEGFEKKLQLKGIGYRVELQGQKLILSLGYSHPVEFVALPGIALNVEKNIITISGVDKCLVGETAARIRKLRPPEPYKGKGIRYKDEKVKLKPGKAAKSAVGAGG